ncbi:MAG TPA: DsrE/DsrF/DrsH-like family protein [Anaeromyxobacter sp.]|nr:DsrE/DsrF/DrsH-like family protein [Anaeromyxobacter sp.]
MNKKVTANHVLDVKGLKCPMPVLKTKLQFNKMQPGEVVEVITTDAGSIKDLPAWADKTGNVLVHSSNDGEGVYRFFLKKGAEVQSAAASTSEEPATKSGAGTKQRSMLLICSKGTLDMAYPPLILASTAASMDVAVQIFFTFYGLDIINRRKYHKLKVAPLGNPAMPVPVPNLIGALPGMTAMATSMMRGMMKKGNVPDITELIRTCHGMGVKFLSCQMTMDVMGVKREDLIDEVDACVGAAAFVAEALDADISMFI